MDQLASHHLLAIDLLIEPPFVIGATRVDPPAHELMIDGKVKRLQALQMKVLVALAQQQGHIVSRDDLVQRCWDGRIVGEDVINRAISQIRKAAANGGIAIDTVPKAGYRLVEAKEAAKTQSKWWLGAAAAAAALVAGLAWQQQKAPAGPPPPVIALTLFASGNDAASRDLAAASSEALSHMLLDGTRAPRLLWPATDADRASADFLLYGDVRRVGDGFAVIVQLRDRATGTIMFSRQFQTNTDNADGLPEHIGAEMSSNVNGALAMLALTAGNGAKPQITADFLKQNAIIIEGADTLGSYQVARQLYVEDPDSVLTNLALAFSTAFALGSLPPDQRPAAVQQGRDVADKLVRIAPEFGDSYVPWCLLRPASQLEACERRIRQGMDADDDAPYAPVFLADLLARVGRHEEALVIARATLADQPYQPHKLRRVILMAIVDGDTEGAEAVYAKARRWWPDHGGVLSSLVTGYAFKGDIAGMEAALDKLPPDFSRFDRRQLSSIIDAERAGDGARLRAACSPTEMDRVERLVCIGALARFDDRDTAFAIAEQMTPNVATGSESGDEQAFLQEPHSRGSIDIAYPVFAWLRSDPRYLVLAERTGLLAYWRAGHLPDFCRGPRPDPVCKQF